MPSPDISFIATAESAGRTSQEDLKQPVKLAAQPVTPDKKSIPASDEQILELKKPVRKMNKPASEPAKDVYRRKI